MAQGIQVPLVPKYGRLKLLSGDEYIQHLVGIAMGDNNSDNPFQAISFGGERFVFRLNDSLSEGEIRTGVVKVFESLERDQLAKVDRNDITFERSREGELKMTVIYTNLETQERVEFEVPIPPEGE